MIVVEREIRTPPAGLWSYVSDLDRWAEMLPTVTDIASVGDTGPITVGSRFRVEQPGLVTAEYEVTDWRPQQGFTWVARTGGVRTEGSHELHPSGTGTRLELAIGWSGPGAFLVKALFSRKARSFVEQEAAAFADLAERGSD